MRPLRCPQRGSNSRLGTALRRSCAANAEYSAGLVPIPPRRSNAPTTNLASMNTTQRETSRPAVVDCRTAAEQLASAREGAPDGRRRGIFSRHRVGHTAKELKMEPVLNPLLFDD